MLTLIVLVLVLLGCATTLKTSGNTGGAFIVAPENHRPWDANGSSKDFDRTASARNGMVASSKYEASSIGRQILQAGGNAIDAAVAMGFALGVCEPFTSGLGGGGFMTIYLADKGEAFFIDFREVAPLKSTLELYHDSNGEFIEDSSSSGGLAVGVPGEAAGLIYALENYGTMNREQVIRPAANMAAQGWLSTPYYNASVGWGYGDMVDDDAGLTDLGEVFLRDSLPPDVGTVVDNPGLAKALELIIKNGKDGFYKGEVAQALVNTVQAGGGVMTLEDLAGYKVRVLEPVKGNYRGYDIFSSPPPSSGGTAFIQIMNLLENFPVYKKDSVEQIHLLAEIHKLVYADRAQYMADPRFADVPLKGLTSKEYAAKLAGKINMSAAQTQTFDDPWTFEGSDTNGSVVMDSKGNMVAVTKSINYYWGSGLIVKDFGITLNNQLDDFSFNKDSVNVLEPGKTPLSSMSPTVILKDGKPAMLLSAPGGSKIFPVLTQLFSNIVDYGMTTDEALQANRFIGIWGNLEYDAPNMVGSEAIRTLASMGHSMAEKTGSRFALPSIIAIDKNGVITGSSEHIDEGIFLDGLALGY